MIRVYHTATQNWMFGPYDWVIYDTETEKCIGVSTEILLLQDASHITYDWFTPSDNISYVEAPTLADILSSYPELLI